IAEITTRNLFHTFCKNFAKELHKTWICTPAGEDLKEGISNHTELGFLGAVGSSAVTHIKWNKAPTSHSVSYQVTVDHNGCVLEATGGFT
ncbi:unnamed protein product, partial [Discosporangium mesarthrocarpum]